MPEQASNHAQAVTASNITAPFQNQIIRFGQKGLKLRDSLDVLDGWSRHTNLDHTENGEAILRPGLTSFAQAGTVHHSVRKLRDPNAGTTTRVWGIDSSLYLGLNGGLSAIDTGYSGNPLALVPHRPPLSGQSWMFIGDSTRVRKVRSDGLVLPWGLPAPGGQPTVALGIENRTNICTGGATDSTNASAWTMVAGSDADGNASNPPTILDDMSPSTSAIAITLDPGATIGNNKTFDSWGGVAINQDLTHLTPISGGGGPIPASDDDIFHLWMKTSHPQNIEEIRVYVVVSASFDPTGLPGIVGGNGDAYVKSFRQNDFVQFIQAEQTQIDAAETARIFAFRDQDLTDRALNDTRPGAASAVSKTDPIRDLSVQIGSAQHEWFEMGSIGLPLRRGDFKRIGSTVGRDWSTATGVILYISSAQGALLVGFGGCWLTGGYGPDTLEPGAQPYDYVYTNYDPRTGCEGNPSPAFPDPITQGIDSLRRQINVTPAAYGDPAIRQRIYRRGGSLVTDFFFCNQNGSDGGQFADQFTDDGIAAAGTVNDDHFQPFPTVDSSGNTILAQPLPAIWGPDQGMLFGCGDPYQPGHLFFTIPDEPDHASAFGNTEVCPPSEQLMNGGLLGNQDFVMSRLAMYMVYPNLTGTEGTVTTNPSLCKRGLKGRWAFAIGPGGVFFVSSDGVYVSDGGPEAWLSSDIDPLFNGKTKNGYLPIDLTSTGEVALRLTIWQNQLFFGYQDTGGTRQVLIYHLLLKFWRHYTFGRGQAHLQGLDEDTLLIGGLTTGATYKLAGTSDDSLAIPWVARTGAVSGGLREEKLFGDLFIDADAAGSTVTVQTLLDEEFAPNNTQTLPVLSGRARTILDAFGNGPQKAHSISLDVRGTANGQVPVLYQAGVAVTLQPDLTNQRVTNWDDLGSADEVWLTGITLDCDTGGATVTVLIEYDFNGTKTVAATLSVTANGRHKQTFSWPAVSAKQVRIHPNSPACQVWLLYRADWIWQVEPPRIAFWDIHFENQFDQYYTGLDLYCDTFGQTKQVEVYVDEVRLTNGNLTYWPVQTVGRNVVHLTLPWGRGHVFRFRAIDTNPGLLYTHRWFLQAEPSEQANWNQNYSIYGTRADKWLKAVLFEVDTFGANKTVNVEIDGAVVQTLTVQATGRSVVQLALNTQHLGRVMRVIPVDGNPSRLYSVQPIFDEEPLALTRFETQETTHAIPGWFTAIYGHVVLKASAPVTLTILVQVNQPRLGSTPKTVSFTYTIPPTGGVKASQFVPFQASKGVLIKYILSSPVAFWLYREETVIVVQPWGASAPMTVHPFGDDDEDPARQMATQPADTTVPAVPAQSR